MSTSNPGLTEEARENRLISMALDIAEKQLRDGTAPPSVVAHFLKIGSQRASLETERIRAETEMLIAKRKLAEASEQNEIMYKDAIEAMKRYNRSDDDEY